MQDAPERMNDSGTRRLTAPGLTHECSGPVRFELVDKDGIKAPMTFGTAAAAANHARMMWPDQEQDPDRTGRGWDISVVGAE